MKKYLYLRFENAGLIIPDKINKHFIKNAANKGEYIKECGYDLTTPIPYHVLSGVLAHLCGEIPVPTKRQTNFKRIDVLDEIAKNSYVKYDIKPIIDEKGHILNAETFRTQKTAYNTEMKVSTTLVDFNGIEHNYKGKYNWDYLRRCFGDEEDFNKLVYFINDCLKNDVTQLTFPEMYLHLSKLHNNIQFHNKVENFLTNHQSISNELKSSWKYVLFGIKHNGKLPTAGNTSYSSRTALLYSSGTAKIVYISGNIICPIDNNTIIESLYENTGTATILEGGFVFTLGLENYPPVPNFEHKFEKIFIEKISQDAENEEVI